MQNKFWNITKSAFAQLTDWDIYSNKWAFWLLLVIPLIFILKHFKKRKDYLSFSSSVVDFNHQQLESKLYPYWSPIFFSLSILFLIFALARPQSSDNWETSSIEGIDITIAMDVSTSMLARDFKPDRLQASKKIASEFIRNRKSDRFGLVIFAGESFTQCPITTDHSRLLELFDKVDIGLLEDGTAIGSGLATSVKRLKNSDALSKVIILLTDGENNSGEIAPETAARLAKKFDIKVYTIAIGSKGNALTPVAYNFDGSFVYRNVPVSIDEDLLKKIAKTTNGKFFRATSNEGLAQIYEEIDALEKTEMQSVKYHKKTELFLPFLLLGLLFQLIYRVLKITYLKRL